MLIGELSDKTGLSKDTIRFYEKQGLIKVNRKERRINNYKEYSNEICERLQIIKQIKGFGFTLNEVSDIIEMIESRTNSCSNITQKAFEKIDLIEKKIVELEKIKTMLIVGIEQCQVYCETTNTTDNCQVLSPKFSID
ncbi:MAG: MerR family transcriptional regulator [Acidobacteriota bacterium]